MRCGGNSFRGSQLNKTDFFLSSYVKSSKMECNAWLMLGKSIPGMSKYDKHS